MAEQRRVGLETKIGEILTRTGTISEDDLSTALEAQKLLRSKSRSDRAIGASKLSSLSTRSLLRCAEEARETAAIEVVGGSKG